MNIARYPVFLCLLLLIATKTLAQIPVVTAEDVKSRLTGSKKVVVVDTRTSEEYSAGHIPGAVNIPPDLMKSEAARLPRDRSVPMIFYCRGAG